MLFGKRFIARKKRGFASQYKYSVLCDSIQKISTLFPGSQLEIFQARS